MSRHRSTARAAAGGHLVRIPVPERRAALWLEVARAHNRQGRLADGYRALRMAETCAAQDVRRPAVRDLVADMVAVTVAAACPDPNGASSPASCPT